MSTMFISISFFFILLLLCPFATPSALTANDQAVAVDCHNAFRSQLAQGMAANRTGTMPSGRNIIQLDYDTGVEAVATRWADQCTMAHSSSSSRPGMGENLFFTTDPTISNANALRQACTNWWNELVQFGFGSPSSLQLNMQEFNKGIGHWSQMAWARTTRLGCAVGRCPNARWKTYVVCNYSPLGNILGQSVYERGTACSACSSSGGSCNSSTKLCRT